MIRRLNHVAIAVPDLEKSLAFWRDTLGLPLSHVAESAGQKVKVGFLPVGDGEVELVQPSDPSSTTAKFLERYGSGLHHIALEVDNLDLMLADLKTKGIALINDAPVPALGGRAAFIHPRSADGVLVELFEKEDRHGS